MAVSGQIRSREYYNTIGFIIANKIKATMEMLLPINFHFHASPSPIKPIPAIDNCKIALGAIVVSIFSPKKVSPINMSKENRIIKLLIPLRIQCDILCNFIFIVFTFLLRLFSYVPQKRLSKVILIWIKLKKQLKTQAIV